MELKPGSTLRIIRRSIKGVPEEDAEVLNKFLFFYRDNLAKERKHITKYFVKPGYECRYINVHSMLTVICIKEELFPKVNIKNVKNYSTNALGEAVANNSYGGYTLGQKGGMITQIQIGNNYMFNIHVHLDAFSADKRWTQISQVVRIMTDYMANDLQMELSQIPDEEGNEKGYFKASMENFFFWINGDFNGRLTPEEKDIVDNGGDFVHKIVKDLKASEEFTTQHLRNLDIREPFGDFPPTYKFTKNISEDGFEAIQNCKSTSNQCNIGQFYVKESKMFGKDKISLGYTDRFFHAKHVPPFVLADQQDENNYRLPVTKYDTLQLYYSYTDHIPVYAVFEIESLENLDDIDNVELEAEVFDNNESYEVSLEAIKQQIANLIFEKNDDEGNESVVEKLIEAYNCSFEELKAFMQLDDYAIETFECQNPISESTIDEILETVTIEWDYDIDNGEVEFSQEDEDFLLI